MEAFCLRLWWGSLWHFIYDWIGRPEFLWWLFPVSEKVEEHYKLLIYPNLIYGLLMFRFMYRHIRYYWLRLAVGSGLGCVAIRGLFDAYTAVLKKAYADHGFIRICRQYIGILCILLKKELKEVPAYEAVLL